MMRWSLRCGLVLVGMLVLVGAPAQGWAAEGKWVSLAPFPDPGEEVVGAAAGGKLYVFMGIKPVWVPKGGVFEYDPGANAWTKKKPMPLASHHSQYSGRSPRSSASAAMRSIST